MVKSVHSLSRVEAASPSDLEKSPHVDYRSTSSIVISGPELITLNEYQCEQLCKYDEIVFARTTPGQKLRIVREFQIRMRSSA